MLLPGGGGGPAGTTPLPYPNLHFPVAEAEHVIDAARQAIQVVQSAASDRRKQVRSLKANAQWTGNAANQFFGSDAPSMVSNASSVIGQLHAVIHIAQGGIDAFHAAQAANAAVARANADAKAAAKAAAKKNATPSPTPNPAPAGP